MLSTYSSLVWCGFAASLLVGGAAFLIILLGGAVSPLTCLEGCHFQFRTSCCPFFIVFAPMFRGIPRFSTFHVFFILSCFLFFVFLQCFPLNTRKQ